MVKVKAEKLTMFETIPLTFKTLVAAEMTADLINEQVENLRNNKIPYITIDRLYKIIELNSYGAIEFQRKRSDEWTGWSLDDIWFSIVREPTNCDYAIKVHGHVKCFIDEHTYSLKWYKITH